MGTESNLPQKAVAFNSNIDLTNQIVIDINNGAVGYRSRCEGKAISLYRNGELLADGTMSTGAVMSGAFLSLCGAELTFHDDTFTAFLEEDTYTLGIGDEEPIGMAFADDTTLFTQELYDGLVPYILGVDNRWYVRGNATSFSVAQKVQTTKKKYDIKLLPEELLPKSVAKKSEVKKAEKLASDALDAANKALNKANMSPTLSDPVFYGSFSQNRMHNSTIGKNSHAEGYVTVASGENSHAEGYGTVAQSLYQHVQGSYNIAQGDSTNPSSSDYIHIVGNGIVGKRSNAHTLDRSGNAWFAGDVYVGSTSGKDKDEGSKKLATESYVDNRITSKEIYLASSTPNSTKQFKITVDDTGTISATEVTT